MQADLAPKQLARELTFLRAFYHATPDLVWLKDADGTYLACNPAFEAYRGARACEIVGKSDFDFVDAETARRRRRIDQEAMTHGQARSSDEWLTFPDGRLRPLRITITALRGTDDELIGVLGIARPISKPTHAGQALRDNAARFRTLVEQSPDWIWSIDTQGSPTYSNDAGPAALGYSTEELVRIAPATLIHPDDLRLFHETYQRALATQAGWKNVVLRWRHRDGSYRWLDSTASALFDEEGRFLGFQGVDRDITELRSRYEADQQLASIVQYAHDFIGIADMKGNIQFVNQAGRALVALGGPEEIQGRKIPDFIHETSRQLMVEQILPTVMAAGHWSGELQFRDLRTGAAIPVLSECFRIDDPTGKPINIATVSRDILERKRHERIVARHNRVLHTIASLNEMLMADLDEPQLMARTCGALVQDNQFRMAWIGRIEPDGVRVRVAAGAGFDQDYLSRADIRCDQSPEGKGPTGQAIRLGRTVINEDTETNEQFAPWRAQALSMGYRSSAATPLRVHGQVTGAVNLYSDEPNAFGPDEVVLLEKLAADLGFALERRAAESALRASEERYRQISSVTTDVLFSCVRDDRRQFNLEWAAGSVDRVFGYSVDMLLQRPCWRCLVHPDDLAIFDAHITDLTPGQSSECELRIIRNDGSVRFVQTYCKLVEADPGTHRHRLYGACQDITERKLAERALRESEARFRTLFESLDAVAVQGFTPDGTVTYWNHASEKLYGYGVDEAIGGNLLDLIVPPEMRPEITGMMHQMLESGQGSPPCRYALMHKDGSRVPVYASQAVVKIPGKTPTLFCLDVDLTALDRAESALAESEQRYRALFNASGDCILVLRGEQIVDCNAVAMQILARTREQIVGQSIIRFSPETQPNGQVSTEKVRDIMATALQGKTRIFEWRFVRYDDTAFEAEVSLTRADLGGQAHLIATLRDISERKQAEERIEFLAHHDALTGLPNRILLRDRFEHALAFAERGKSHVAMLFLDLDNFKVVNDTLGHAAGDRLLLSVVSRLGECVRDTDTVSRQGGDEFILLLNDIFHPEAVERVAGDVLTRLSEPIEIGGHVLNTPCSIGISLYPDDGKDFDSLLQKADTAMYNAKDAGRNTYRFFDEEMNRRAREHLLLQNRLHQALRNGELSLHFQPQWEIGSDRVLGVEALLRWHNSELGDVAPSRFIPVAEDCGLIVPIGAWVLEQACRQAQEWRSAGFGDLSVSVNLSALQFRRAGLVESVVSALEKSGLPPHLLELELTESVLLQHLDNTLESVQRLKTLGVRLAIDDFGTGYSSLSYLKRFAVDKLKIDQTFVRDIGFDPDDAAIVRAIIQLAQGLHLEIVAEGVETEAQLAFLRDAGCPEVQGYLFSRPLAAGALEAFLRNRADR